MRIRKITVTITGLIGTLLLCQAGLSFPANPNQEPVFRATVNVVNIICTVQDPNRKYVTELNREDFRVYEDGVLQNIDYFSHAARTDSPPLSVVLLVDTSESVKDKIRFEKQAAKEFIGEVLGTKRDTAAITFFGTKVRLSQGFTHDQNLLERALADARPGGATCLYDGIWLSVKLLLSQRQGRRMLVILSDGSDSASLLNDREAQRIALQEEVTVYAIGVRSAHFSSNYDLLKEISEATGGAFFNSRADLHRLRAVFSEVNQAISSQYSIGYDSTNQTRDGRFRKITIKLNRRGLKIFHRDGYYTD